MQPNNARRTASALRRWLIVLMCAVMSVMCLLAIYIVWKRWGPLPDIRVAGRVINRDTAIGVADANVIIAITASEPMWHGSHRGCTNGSAVVRTDRAGNFSYTVSARDAFGPRNPSGWGVTLFVYHPEYEAALRRDLFPHQREWVVELGADGPPLPVPTNYRTYPLHAYQAPGPFEIEVIGRRETELDQLFYFGTGLYEQCLHVQTDHGQVELLRRIFLRTWELSCGHEARARGLASNEFEAARTVLYVTLAAIAAMTDIYGSKDERDQRNSDRSECLWMYHLWEYPERRDESGYGRGPTDDELSVFCDTYAPPLENTLRREFRSWIDSQHYADPDSLLRSTSPGQGATNDAR